MPDPSTPKRKLELDLRELEAAFEEDTSWEVNHYLDLETGRVVSITSDTHQAMEDLYQELDDEGADQTDWQAAIQQHDLPDWEKNELLLADQVEAGYGTRYIRIPQADSHQVYEDMQDLSPQSKSNLCKIACGMPSVARALFAASKMCWPRITVNGNAGSSSKVNARGDGCWTG